MAPLYRVAVAALFTLTSFVSAQDQIPLVCYDQGVQVIALAGSNVANGTYGYGGSFVNNIVNRIGNSSTMSLNYNRFHLQSQVGMYFASEVTQGVGALTAALNNYTAACPNTPIVIHGYSEGGVVVMNTLCGSNGPAWPYVQPVAAAATWAKSVIAVILYGEETRIAGQPYNLGGCTASSPGKLPRANPAWCGPFIPKMASYCLPDDPDCCSTYNPANSIAPNGQVWHYQYPTYFDDIAANFIVSQWDEYNKDVVTTSEIPAGVTELGCFLDSSDRVLPLFMGQFSNNSVATCSGLCRQAGYQYSGTENGDECYCGTSLPPNSDIIDGCWTPCTGAPLQNCGNGWRINVYFDSIAVPLASKLPTGISTYGCYVDSCNGACNRALPVQLYVNSSNTANMCALGCRAAGYIYSGTENGQECYCGSIAPSQIADNSTCNTPCPGFPYETCGGGWRLSVLKDSTVTLKSAYAMGVVAQGCYTDGWTRTLPFQAYVGNNNTLGNCATACSSLNYIYSGTENGQECWCGNTLPASYATTNSSCSTFCTGDPSEICGGGFLLNVAKDTTITVGPLPLPKGIVNMGCYSDSGAYSSTRTLATQLYDNSTNSNNQCALACRAAGFVYSGTEYGSQCFCDNFPPAASLQVAPGNCSMPCAGPGDQLCGGGWLLTIQQDTTPTVMPSKLPTGWAAIGCYLDDWTRTFPVQLWANSSNSNTACTTACGKAGYQYAGTENGDECWCGSSMPTTAVEPASDCRTPCLADSTQACGGGFRLTTFKNNAYSPYPNGTIPSRRSLTKGRYTPNRPHSW